MSEIFSIRNPIVVDTETYYDENCSVIAEMKKRQWVGGNWHYTNHPSFYCYMITWLDLATGRKGIIDDPAEFQAFVKSLEGCTLVMHNGGFDVAVLKWIDKTFEPFNVVDTADMAQYLQFPRSLKGAVKQMFGKEISKAEREGMKGKHYRELSDAARSAMREYALGDAEWTAEIFKKYIDHWPKLEQWASNFTREQNWNGVHIDREYHQLQVDAVSKRRNAAVAKIPWVEDITEDKPLSPKQLAIYCRSVGIEPPTSLAEDSEECQAWELKYGDTFPVVGALRDYRKSNTYYKKLKLIELLLRPDGTIPFATKYAAAPHTLRFSATQFNYQSLPRVADFCDLRGCLIPPPGTAFIGADLSGIEARCLPWLAGDYEFLNQLAKLDAESVRLDQTGGGDIYEPHARRMFGYSDPKPLKKVDKVLRNVTKVCVLQLGYQSGAKKFNWYLDNNVTKDVRDRVRQGTETDMDLSVRLVRLFRGMNMKYQDLWYSLDRELKSCVGGDFKLQLPNGGVVNYYDLAIREGFDAEGKPRSEVVGRVVKGEGEMKKLYGGKITENICQRMARDVIVENIYNLAQAGYKSSMTIHDENVPPVALDRVDTPQKARDVCREVESIMSRTPAWAPGLPLASETGILHRYAK